MQAEKLVFEFSMLETLTHDVSSQENHQVSHI